MANESSPIPESAESLDDPVSLEVGAENVFEACPSCKTLMDMSDVMPFTEVTCPNCQHTMRARQHFNHFTLIEQIGEGGMGAVFKALDNNLNRYVALKILKKEISANAEEQEKLAKEARLTAAINHPHVVKVYHFGRDHGQFYLAMELVEKGSLDQLMAVQKRVGEAQVLEVGMQIAMGLGAALELDLIHRDIKPGNILFADAHTAKLVDFGLAIVMDEEASVRGEIWGTPYYIAPEKLDNQAEDFRSDIYSLGGTLFHALAGRPPYEAESASMVALKQLKSQQVSLQAFAPDVSSETAYVINRMMAKNPEGRYQSYEELIGHLTYARDKLLERARKPLRPKQRLVIETDETRKFSAIISLVLLGMVFLAGLGAFLMRDKIFPATEIVPNLPDKNVSGKSDPVKSVPGKNTPAKDSPGKSAPRQGVPGRVSAQEADALLLAGVTSLAHDDPERAKSEFEKLVDRADFPEPQKSWAVLNGAVASLRLGDKDAALKSLTNLSKAGLFSTDSEDEKLANFFVEVGRVVSQDKLVPAAIQRLYDDQSDAFALLVFAVWDWEAQATFSDASKLLQGFLARVSPNDWASKYKPLASNYIADWKALEPLLKAYAKVNSAESASDLLAQISSVRSRVQSGNKIKKRLDVLEEQVKAKASPH